MGDLDAPARLLDSRVFVVPSITDERGYQSEQVIGGNKSSPDVVLEIHAGQACTTKLSTYGIPRTSFFGVTASLPGLSPWPSTIAAASISWRCAQRSPTCHQIAENANIGLIHDSRENRCRRVPSGSPPMHRASGWGGANVEGSNAKCGPPSLSSIAVHHSLTRLKTR